MKKKTILAIGMASFMIAMAFGAGLSASAAGENSVLDKCSICDVNSSLLSWSNISNGIGFSLAMISLFDKFNCFAF